MCCNARDGTIMHVICEHCERFINHDICNEICSLVFYDVLKPNITFDDIDSPNNHMPTYFAVTISSLRKDHNLFILEDKTKLNPTFIFNLNSIINSICHDLLKLMPNYFGKQHVELHIALNSHHVSSFKLNVFGCHNSLDQSSTYRGLTRDHRCRFIKGLHYNIETSFVVYAQQRG